VVIPERWAAQARSLSRGSSRPYNRRPAGDIRAASTGVITDAVLRSASRARRLRRARRPPSSGSGAGGRGTEGCRAYFGLFRPNSCRPDPTTRSWTAASTSPESMAGSGGSASSVGLGARKLFDLAARSQRSSRSRRWNSEANRSAPHLVAACCAYRSKAVSTSSSSVSSMGWISARNPRRLQSRTGSGISRPEITSETPDPAGDGLSLTEA
jgi:hypothetical protein